MAFLDESYSVDPQHGSTFYLISAVIVEPDQMKPLRDGLNEHVPDGWWHTTDELLTDEGRERTRKLLAYLAEGREVCVVSHLRRLARDDRDGEAGRRASLCAIFRHLWCRPDGEGGPVRLAVLEERREVRQRRVDMRTRSQAVDQGLCGAAFRLVQVSPGAEHLLWLPDLACSAYRRKIINGDGAYFAEIQGMTQVVNVP